MTICHRPYHSTLDDVKVVMQRRINRMYTMIDKCDKIYFIRTGSNIGWDHDKNILIAHPNINECEGWMSSLGRYEGNNQCRQILNERLPKIFPGKDIHVRFIQTQNQIDALSKELSECVDINSTN